MARVDVERDLIAHPLKTIEKLLEDKSVHLIGVECYENPLPTAIEYGNLEILKLILKHGHVSSSDAMETKDCDGNNLLMIAIDSGKKDIAEYLLKQYRNYISINEANKDGETALMYYANNNGVLQFDGANWRLNRLPNNYSSGR